jgi:FtsZ-binding cell division protein ZapB
MKLELKDIIYIALLVAAGYFIFSLNSELSGANKSIKTLNVELNDQKESNINAFEVLEEKINSQVDLTQKLQVDILDLENSKTAIYHKSNENKTIINSTHNADSLARLISRRYR